jgi:hypothetical protein
VPVAEDDVPADLAEVGIGLDTSIGAGHEVLQDDHAQ